MCFSLWPSVLFFFFFGGGGTGKQWLPRHDAASDQGLHCLLTECSIKTGIKMKTVAQRPLKRKWTGPISISGKIHSASMG